MRALGSLLCAATTRGRRGLQCGQRRSGTSWSLVKWNPDLVNDWTPQPVPELTQSHRKYASEAFAKPAWTGLLASVLQTASQLENAPDTAL